MKRIVTIILTVFILTGMISAGVQAKTVKKLKVGPKAYATFNKKTKTLNIKGKGALRDVDSDETFVSHSDGQKLCKMKDVKKIVVGKGITSLGKSCFDDFKNVKKISLPATVKKIDEYAIANCPKLTTITLPKNLKTMETNAVVGCSSLKSFKISSKNKKFSVKDGVLFNKNQTTLIRYPEGKKDAAYTVPDSVKTIEEYSFKWCRAKTVNINENIEDIGSGAFYFSDVTTLYFTGKMPSVNSRYHIFENNKKPKVKAYYHEAIWGNDPYDFEHFGDMFEWIKY